MPGTRIRGTCRSAGSRTPSSPIMPQERRVGDVVVDDEAHVDRERPIGRVDDDGLHVPTHRRLGVVQRDVVLAMQGVGGTEAADPGPDDRDAHQSGPRGGRRPVPSPPACRPCPSPHRGRSARTCRRGTAGGAVGCRAAGCPPCSRSPCRRRCARTGCRRRHLRRIPRPARTTRSGRSKVVMRYVIGATRPPMRTPSS